MNNILRLILVRAVYMPDLVLHVANVILPSCIGYVFVLWQYIHGNAHDCVSARVNILESATAVDGIYLAGSVSLFCMENVFFFAHRQWNKNNENMLCYATLIESN